jgi:hypothetical protein
MNFLPVLSSFTLTLSIPKMINCSCYTSVFDLLTEYNWIEISFERGHPSAKCQQECYAALIE